jgi:hypothetical protein
MGRALVGTPVRQVEGGAAAAEELLFEPELVVRGSTAPAVRRGERPAGGGPRRLAAVASRLEVPLPVVVAAGKVLAWH